MNSYIPITDSKQETEISNYCYDSSSSPTGCGLCSCLKFSYFNWGKGNEVHSRSLLQDHETEHRESWLVILKKLLRKMNRNSKKSKTQFQYDAQSYALNFDDGARGEEDGLLCNFSARFAVPVVAQKQSKNGL
ncbi:hypothetical protein H5410_059163 [Solanum commersonii]|uniref:Uncharacterized protein n=1 Tax=Solanum commersonii TaxID=4109 RepID=A0A9J5W1N6_SOLCO|nr:hypothetical protein H5410_059163 [Solanum commersonii]